MQRAFYVPAQPPVEVGPLLPPRGATHILKSFLQSQANVGLNAGAFLPLPTKHFIEGGVGAWSAHRGV